MHQASTGYTPDEALLVEILVEKAIAHPRYPGYTFWETINTRNPRTQRHISSGQALSSLLISLLGPCFLAVTVVVFMHLNRRE